MDIKTQDRTVKIGDYQFSEGKHLHELLKDGEYKPLTGVTTVLSVIAKPALIQWSANMASDYASGRINSNNLYTEDELADIFKEAKTAHRKKKEAAGDIGSSVHDAIEQWIKNKVMPIFEDERALKMFQNFKEWAETNNVKFIESEKHVYSREMWIGGILDMVIEIEGKRLIADIKTSSGIYNEHFFQMAAYDMCLEEMGEKVDGYLIINLKKDGKFDLKISEMKDINRRAFKSALELYRIINNLE